MFKVRALVAPGSLKSDSHSQGFDRSRALIDLGAEVTEFDPLGSSRHHILDKVFEKAGAAFVTTGSHLQQECAGPLKRQWAPEVEQDYIRSVADAAKKAHTNHVVWSTLEDSRDHTFGDTMPTLFGKYKVPFFDVKGEVDCYFKNIGLPTTYFLAPFYWDVQSFVTFGMLGAVPGRHSQSEAEADHGFMFPLGGSRLPGMTLEDIARCAVQVLKYPRRHIGKTVGVAAGHLTAFEMAAIMSKAVGCEIKYLEITPADYRQLDKEVENADVIGNMFQFFRDHDDVVCGARSLKKTLKLLASKAPPQTFEEWAVANAEEIKKAIHLTSGGMEAPAQEQSLPEEAEEPLETEEAAGGAVTTTDTTKRLTIDVDNLSDDV